MYGCTHGQLKVVKHIHVIRTNMPVDSKVRTISLHVQ